MQYVGFLLRRERLSRNWSQEGLCRGICTVSYLSKIEQGKTDPSPEIISMLLARMELPWYPSNPQDGEFISGAYESLFSMNDTLRSTLARAPKNHYLYSPYGPDLLLLERLCDWNGAPLEEALEPCLDGRQLALQRLLQGRYSEAFRLYPCAYICHRMGEDHYRRGRIAQALESLQTAYQLAAQEGRPWVMLYARIITGNCYSNQQDLVAMTTHYQVASRLAEALGAEAVLRSIRYNTAASQLEAGNAAEALAHLQAMSSHDKLSLHKLAICQEKLGDLAAARQALEQAEVARADNSIPDDLSALMLSLVRFRLDCPNYLQNEHYGELVLKCFVKCRDQLPSGYALFHLPWVLEWYEAHRQYKKAFDLLRDFPAAVAKTQS